MRKKQKNVNIKILEINYINLGVWRNGRRYGLKIR